MNFSAKFNGFPLCEWVNYGVIAKICRKCPMWHSVKLSFLYFSNTFIKIKMYFVDTFIKIMYNSSFFAIQKSR